MFVSGLRTTEVLKRKFRIKDLKFLIKSIKMCIVALTRLMIYHIYFLSRTRYEELTKSMSILSVGNKQKVHSYRVFRSNCQYLDIDQKYIIEQVSGLMVVTDGL